MLDRRTRGEWKKFKMNGRGSEKGFGRKKRRDMNEEG